MQGKFTDIKYLLLPFVMAFLFLPIIMPYLIIDPPLKGAIIKTERPLFSLNEWFEGTYQQQLEKYANENFGGRNTLVRLNNQIAFSFFNEAKANGVIIGKDNYLYEENYIKAYCGTDFIGEDKISERLAKLKFLQDTLKKLNKELIVIYAPGKGSFYPEYIPDEFKKTKSTTNYECYSKKTKELGINCIDFHDWFIKNKSKSKYPLYPQYGIHWSAYGTMLAADSIIKYVEGIKGIDLPNLILGKIEMGNEPRDADYDIEDGMNILFRLKTFPMAYQNFQIDRDTPKIRINSLVIADSYYWGIFGRGIQTAIFKEAHFWYYNKEIYPESHEKPLSVDQINLKQEIEKQDVIIILSTDANLPNLGWGFIEDAYKLYAYKEEKRNAR